MISIIWSRYTNYSQDSDTNYLIEDHTLKVKRIES